MSLSSFDIFQLWTTPLLVQSLPGHGPHTERLAELVSAGDADSVMTRDDASVAWLKSHVIHGISAVLRVMGHEVMPAVAVRGRVDVHSLEDYHSLDNRPGAYLSGLYVVRVPSGDPVLGAREDRRPGCITFYDPRVGMNMNAIHKDPYVNYHHTVKFEQGMLLVWPSFVSYFLHPHLSREPAVRIGFDVQLSADAADAGSSP